MMANMWKPLFLVVAFLAPIGVARAADPPRPNILFLYADDLGYGDLACYGHPRSQTPRLDRLAAEGTRFTQFYVSHCLCSPTRSSAITGQFPSRHRIFAHLSALEANTSRGMPHWLDVAAPSLPRALQKAGYRTAHFGKWHLGGGSGAYRDGKLFVNHPDAPPVVDYGFDVARSTFGNSPTWKAAEPVDKPHEIYPYEDGPWLTWSSRAIADATISFLEESAARHKRQPFYVQAWFKDVHTPMKPTDEMRASFTDLPEPTQTHLAMLRFMDAQIGRILDKLAELGLADETLVVFTSDNGAAMGRGGSNGPLRAWKWTLYEGGIREPFIVRWPGHVSVGRVDETSVLNICDFVPTLCRLTGATMGDGYEGDGEDMSDALLVRSFTRSKPMFWFHPTGGDRSPTLAVRDGDWKLLMNPGGKPLELYDLKSDIGEKQNVADKKPEVASRLRDQLLTFYRGIPKKAD
jgi:N-acetylgalactosamine-6-sulfatase